jgi:hypothetical protein
MKEDEIFSLIEIKVKESTEKNKRKSLVYWDSDKIGKMRRNNVEISSVPGTKNLCSLYLPFHFFDCINILPHQR